MYADRLQVSPTLADSVPQRSPLQRDMVRLLTAALGDTVQVAATAGQAAGEGWLSVTAPGLWLRPTLDARPIHAERIWEVAALIDAADGLLDTVEQRTGLMLEPEDVLILLPEGAVCVDLVAGESGLRLAFTDSFTIPSALREAAARAAPLSADALQPCRVQLAAATLPIADAAALAPGDVLLLGRGEVAGRAVAGERAIDIQLHLASGKLSSFPSMGGPDPMSDTDAAAAVPRDFSVPIAVELPECALSVADLAALTKGSIVDLAPVREGLPVTLRVAGRLFARGQIVRIGETYGVEISEKVSADSAEARTASQPNPPVSTSVATPASGVSGDDVITVTPDGTAQPARSDMA